MKKFNKVYNELMESLNERTSIYSLSEIEQLLRNKKIAKLISDITNATSETAYTKALGIFSGITLNDIDKVDQLVAYSADKLHYNQKLDDDISNYLDAISDAIKNS